MEMIEINKLADKLKWIDQFRKNYPKGCFRRLPNEDYEPEFSRFFVAKEAGKELGFVRITNQSDIDSPLKEVWCISDAYVKAPYRGQGVLKEMITYTKKNCHVHMIYMEEERFYENWTYYLMADLASMLCPQGNGLAYVYDKELTESIKNYSAVFMKRFRKRTDELLSTFN